MYSKIENPLTGRRVSINGKLGRSILRNYLNVLSGGSEPNLSANERYYNAVSGNHTPVGWRGGREIDDREGGARAGGVESSAPRPHFLLPRKLTPGIAGAIKRTDIQRMKTHQARPGGHMEMLDFIHKGRVRQNELESEGDASQTFDEELMGTVDGVASHPDAGGVISPYSSWEIVDPETTVGRPVNPIGVRRGDRGDPEIDTKFDDPEAYLDILEIEQLSPTSRDMALHIDTEASDELDGSGWVFSTRPEIGDLWVYPPKSSVYPHTSTPVELSITRSQPSLARQYSDDLASGRLF